MADAPSLADASAATVAALTTANTDVAPTGVTNTPPIETPIVPTVPNVETPPATETPTPETINLDGIDFSQPLTEADVKKIQDGFLRQQDYTRKTQEVAPVRKLVEEVGGDFDKLRQSYDFVNRLENDPDFLAQVAQELQEFAKAPKPTEQPTPALETPQGTDPDLSRRVERIEAFEARMEQERANAELVKDWETKISTAEQAVRASNPSYTDKDISIIYDRFLPATEYDFFKAVDAYEEVRNYFVNEMVRPKLNHPNEANPVATGSLANSPKDINDFAAAAAATRERLRMQGD
jgi:hypothetical protein